MLSIQACPTTVVVYLGSGFIRPSWEPVVTQGQEGAFQLNLLSSSSPPFTFSLFFTLHPHRSSSSPHPHIILTSATPCLCCLFFTYYCLLVSSSHHRESFPVTQIHSVPRTLTLTFMTCIARRASILGILGVGMQLTGFIIPLGSDGVQLLN
jgi:hypothetical protein